MSLARVLLFGIVALPALSDCAPDGSPTGGDPVAGGGDPAPGGGDPVAGGDDPVPNGDALPGDSDPSACPRLPAPADRVRRVIVSHPYLDAPAPDNQAQAFSVWELSPSGALTATGERFTMGRAPVGKDFVFTPDGEIGIVAQDGGTLGVVRLESDGVVVVHEAFQGSFYANRLTMHPSGQWLYVLETAWRNVGGGIYRVSIGCDGTLVDEGLLEPAKLPARLAFLPGSERLALLASRDIGDSPAGDDVHLMDLAGAEPFDATLVAGADAFGDDDGMMSGMAVTAGGGHALIGDSSYVGTNRIAVVELLAGGVGAVQILSPFEDPASIVTSPYDNAALVASGFGDALFHLRYDPLALQPFVVVGEVAYNGGAPQLPDPARLIERGSLTGMVLVAEVQAIRRLRFEPDGSITDLGLTSTGTGNTSIVGTIGVEP